MERDSRPNRIVAVIATLPSRMERLHYAVCSVLAQNRRPDELLVVVDAENGYDTLAHCENLTRNLNLQNTLNVPIRVFANSRTKNVSGTGSWNTAIMEAINIDDFGCNHVTFLAFLDDDDEWRCDHLLRCEDCAGPAVDWVVSGLERRSDAGGTGSIECATPDTVNESSFLRGNPGVQGSNIFMRLPLILRAGCFDESMRSATDRDLCIRALEVMGGREIAFTNAVTVVHHAEPRHVRERVTTDPEAKLLGLRAFLWKHRHRYSTEDWAVMKERQMNLFGIDVDNVAASDNGAHYDPAPTSMTATVSGDRVALQPATLSYLEQHAKVLSMPLGNREPPPGLFGIVSSDIKRLRPLLRDLRELGPSAEIVVFANTRDADEIKEAVLATGRGLVIGFDDPAVMSIAASFYGALGSELPLVDRFEISVARTILQTCMRELLLAPERSAVEFAVVLDDDKRVPAGSLLRSGEGLASLAREGEVSPAIFVGRDCKTAPNTLAFGLRVQLLDLVYTLGRGGKGPHRSDAAVGDAHDVYYDLSSTRFDHLEAPVLASDVHNARARVLRGDPLARDVVPPSRGGETTQRGGCLLLFRRHFDLLSRPQYVPEIVLSEAETSQRILSRRSDSLWVATAGVRCLVHPGLFVFHENTHDLISTPVSIRRNALAETFGAIMCRRESDRLACMHGRLRAVVANNERIRGLLLLLAGAAHKSNEGDDLLALQAHLADAFDEGAWEREVFEPLRRNYGRAVIGYGAEGVVTRDENGVCTKVFFGIAPSASLQLLEAAKVHGCRLISPRVLEYDYVEGESYRGGHYEAMIECMRRVKAAGLIMNNVKPANLVLGRGGEVVIVDLGRDWVPYTHDGFISMCLRGFLSERFGNEDDPKRLCELMRACSRHEDPTSAFPELSGLQAFFERCNLDPALRHVTESIPAKATLIIKTCLMEHKTIYANVQHIVRTLHKAGNHFHETVLAVDRSKRDGFLRQHSPADANAFDRAVARIESHGLIDRVHSFDGADSELLSKLNHIYFGLGAADAFALATHSATGVPHAALFSALETVSTDIVAQIDSDICLNLNAGHEDIVARAASSFARDERIVTALMLPVFSLSPPIDATEFRAVDGLPFRFEIRCSFLHIPRFRSMLPLKGAVGATGLRSWYRVFDDNIASQGCLSMRFVSSGGFFLHPPNCLKADVAEYMLIADRAGAPPRPHTPMWRNQHAKVDIVSQPLWDFGERTEQVIFVLYGCGVPLSLAMRCLRSLGVSGLTHVGLVIVHDAPAVAAAEWPAPLFEEAYRLHPGHVTCIHTGIHLGRRRSLDHTIQRVCFNRHSVIVPLGLDQYLFSGPRSLALVYGAFCEAETFYDRLIGVGSLLCFRRAVYSAIDRTPGYLDEIDCTWTYMCPIDDYTVVQFMSLAGNDRTFRFAEPQVYGFSPVRTNVLIEAKGSLPVYGPELVAPPCTLSTSNDRLWTFAPNPVSSARCIVRVVGEVSGKERVPVRLHSECLTGDGFRSTRCDCGEQRNFFLDLMEDIGIDCAVMVHIAGHEGRGHGLDIKVREYELNDRDLTRNHNDILIRDLGVSSLDPREYGDAARILSDVLGIGSVVLYSNNPSKRNALALRFGSERVAHESMAATMTLQNERYLRDKIGSLNHDSGLVKSLLPPDDALYLLAHLGVNDERPREPVEMLKRMVRAFLERLPFENLTLASCDGSGGSGPISSKTSVLSAKQAVGLCFDRNVILAELLRHLGFAHVDVVGAHTTGNMDGTIHDHVVVVVVVQQGEYLVDVGDGTPYFTPLILPADEAFHSILRYRVRPRNGLFVVEHNRPDERNEWRDNYSFNRADILDARGIGNIVHRHRTDTAFGPMLTHIRINRWCGSGGVVIRDVEGRVILDSHLSSKVIFSTGKELQGFVLQHFGGDILRKLDHAVKPLMSNINAGFWAPPPPPLLRVLETWPPMPVIVTGCAGYIGSHLTRRLLRFGVRVHGVDSVSTLLGDATPKLARIAEFQESGLFTFCRDIDDLPKAEALGPIVVYHLAGQPNVRECERHPDTCRRDNSDLTERLLSRIHHESHVVFAGSSTVYGDAPTPWSEDTVLQPKGAYARSKQACEVHLQSFANRGGKATVLRLFSVTGEQCRPDLAAAKFMKLISEGEAITIYGDGEQERDITYVGDVVKGMLHAGRRATYHRFRVYNFGRGVPTSLNTIIAIIEKELGRTAQRLYEPAISSEALITHASNNRARTELGFDPSVDAATAIKRMILAAKLQG